MNKKHLKSELSFYQQAYKSGGKRREKGFGWRFEPSQTVVAIVRKNKLDKNTKGKRFLDLGCGDGRHLEYFKKIGYDVCGVDFCKESIDSCKKRFRGEEKVALKLVDLTNRNALKSLGQFDLILDWSVLDHIRKKYLNVYLQNILGTVRNDGFGIFAEFDKSLPGLYNGKDYKLINGHYSKSYSTKELAKTLKPLKMIDLKEKTLEDEVNNIRFNTLLMKK